MQRPKVYVTTHPHSRIVGGAYAQGCQGQVIDVSPQTRLLAGPAVVYGILRGCGDIIKQCEHVKRPYFHIDHGYFRPGHYDGFYRVSRNGLQCRISRDFAPDRFEALNVPVRPWKRTGRTVVIAPLSAHVGRHIGVDPGEWLESVRAEIPNWTDRPVAIKPKGEGSLATVLQDAWCLVTHSSNAAVDALLQGVPVITLGKSAVNPVSWHWKHMETPEWYDREPVFWGLAYHQWTLDEMRRGECK